MNYLGLLFADQATNEYLLLLNEESGRIEYAYSIADDVLLERNEHDILIDYFDDLDQLIQENENSNVYSLIYVYGINSVLKPISQNRIKEIKSMMWENTRIHVTYIRLLDITRESTEEDIKKLYFEKIESETNENGKIEIIIKKDF